MSDAVLSTPRISVELASLHVYFTRASAIREDLKPHALKARAQEDKDEFLNALWIMEADRRLSVFYGLVYVVVEGFEELGLHDPEIDALLTDPLRDKLRRYRNAIFHFQVGLPAHEKHLEFHLDEAAPEWINRLWNALNRWFSNNVVRPFYASLPEQEEEPSPSTPNVVGDRPVDE